MRLTKSPLLRQRGLSSASSKQWFLLVARQVFDRRIQERMFGERRARLQVLVKTDLTTWLSGSADMSVHQRGGKSHTRGHGATNGVDALSTETVKRKLDDPQLERISALEVNSIDHNAALRGTKTFFPQESHIRRQAVFISVEKLKTVKGSHSSVQTNTRHSPSS